MKAAIYTLGCKVNQYDSQEISSLLKAHGFEIVNSKSQADIYILNSCTVTAESTRKSKQAVRRFKKAHPDSVVLLTGCFPQAFSEEADCLTEADIVIGNRSNSEIVSILTNYLKERKPFRKFSAHQLTDKYFTCSIDTFAEHTRAFVKIQDGCNRYCSYCTIPKARGFSRSRPLASIKEELSKLAALGYSEIVFVGINLSSYGLECGLSLADALEAAQEIDGIKRIRLGSLEPDHITNTLIERLKKLDKLCPQFHLSLQSGSDSILKRMNRHYTSSEYLTLCKKLQASFPDTSITTDIIVGFPGESDEDFLTTVTFAEKCNFMKVHVFPFSPRKGTPAYKYTDKISDSVKSHRCALLQNKCDSIRASILKSYIGKETDVLFETPKDGYFHGYTANYTPVKVISNQNITGKICRVKILSVENDTCIGELLKDQ